MDSGDKVDRRFETTANAPDPSASVTFIDLLFAVVISLGLSQMITQPWFNPTSWNIVPAYVFEILIILLGYSTLLLSWWGYHHSIHRKGIYGVGWRGKFLFVVDILILIGYWLLLVKFESFLFVLCVLTSTYGLYVCWDWLRSRYETETCRKSWRRRGVTVLWALVLMIILILYAAAKPDGSTPTLMDWAFVVLAHAVNVIYRWHKEHLILGWLLDFLVFKRIQQEAS